MFIRRLFALICAIAMAAGCVCLAEEEATIPEVLFDHVVQPETVTELDYAFVDEIAIESLDLWGKGGCTAVAKVNDAGIAMMGRNMDLNISNKTAYVIRTKVEGDYETMGLAYLFNDFMPDFDDVVANGLNATQKKALPFLCTDIMNSAGLYIETNMRNGECWPGGAGKFTCDGTNPDSANRVFVAVVPRYVAERCATIEEALAYIDTLNIYTQVEPTSWNFCFMMADATGRYGLLEIACDRTIWHEGQQAQANFYIDEELSAIEDLKAGLGRYDTVMAGIDAVQTEEEMFSLIDKAAYFRLYQADRCDFDARSEFVDSKPNWTIDYVMDTANADLVNAELERVRSDIAAMSLQEIRDANAYWVSVFTLVANTSARTIDVRFYEDDARRVKLGFED